MTEWQLGVNAFQEGRIREAADRLRVVANDHERTISQAVIFQIYVYLGAALYALGEASEASEAFTEAVSLRIGKAIPLDLCINQANAYMASGKRRQAEQILSEALSESPGAMEVRTLLGRLQSRDESLPLSGVILGETPESVKRYMETLSFSTTARGFSPDQVGAALAQIARYIDVLSSHLTAREHTIIQYESEIEKLRQTEETLVEHLMQTRQELDNAHRLGDQGTPESNGMQSKEETTSGGSGQSLTPLEKLFQKKN